MRAPQAYVLEVPEPWFAAPDGGARYQAYDAALSAALARRGAAVTRRPIPYHCDFAPRRSLNGEIVLSYHSCGAREAGVWRFKETPVQGFFSVDRLGYSGWSECAVNSGLTRAASALTDDEAARILAPLVAYQSETHASKYAQAAESGARVPLGAVVLLLQISEDSVQRLHRLDMLEVLQRAAACARETLVPLVVKRHPHCQDPRIGAALQALQAAGAIEVSTVSIFDLFAGARAVLTGNSGAGFEALMHGVPVFCTGLAEYAAAAAQIATLDDVARAFTGEGAVSAAEGRRFAAWYLTQRCVDVSSPAWLDALLDQIEAAHASEPFSAAASEALMHEVLAIYAQQENERRLKQRGGT